MVVPVLSPRNELLGALSAGLDLVTVKPHLQYIVRSAPAEVILLAPDGTPLLATQTAATALTPLGPQALHGLRAKSGEPMTFEGHHQRQVPSRRVAPSPRDGMCDVGLSGCSKWTAAIISCVFPSEAGNLLLREINKT